MMRLRFFWYCVLEQGADLYWYHRWTNWITGKTRIVFAGYNRRALCRKTTTFKTAING